MWRQIHEDGCDWEARVVADERRSRSRKPKDVLEFRCLDGRRRPRRVSIPADGLTAMDEPALRRAYRSARPIGGDHYGRPGKPMGDQGHG